MSERNGFVRCKGEQFSRLVCQKETLVACDVSPRYRGKISSTVSVSVSERGQEYLLNKGGTTRIFVPDNYNCNCQGLFLFKRSMARAKRSHACLHKKSKVEESKPAVLARERHKNLANVRK